MLSECLLEARNALCPCCGTNRTDVLCKSCLAPHHSECWVYAGHKCSIYGCGCFEYMRSNEVCIDVSRHEILPKNVLRQSVRQETNGMAEEIFSVSMFVSVLLCVMFIVITLSSLIFSLN